MPKPDFIAPGFVARRAEIVEDDEGEPIKLAGDLSGFYCIVNAKTGAVVGLAKNFDQARRILDKRDTQVGECVHKITPPTKPAQAG